MRIQISMGMGNFWGLSGPLKSMGIATSAFQAVRKISNRQRHGGKSSFKLNFPHHEKSAPCDAACHQNCLTTGYTLLMQKKTSCLTFLFWTLLCQQKTIESASRQQRPSHQVDTVSHRAVDSSRSATRGAAAVCRTTTTGMHTVRRVLPTTWI